MKNSFVTGIAASAIAIMAGSAGFAEDMPRTWQSLTWDDLFNEQSVHTTFNDVAEARTIVQAEQNQVTVFIQDPANYTLPLADERPAQYSGEACYTITVADIWVSDVAYHIYNGNHDLELMSFPVYAVTLVPAEEVNSTLVPKDSLRVNPINRPYETDLTRALEALQNTIGDANGPLIPVIPVTWIGCENNPTALFSIAAEMNRESAVRHSERLGEFLNAYERHHAPRP